MKRAMVVSHNANGIPHSQEQLSLDTLSITKAYMD